MAVVLFVLCMIVLGKQAVVHAAPGSWRVSKTGYSFLTAGQKKIFNKAVKGMTGVTYKPVALLATQTVSGTNYMYLCQGTLVTAKPVTRWYVLTVYKNLKKKVSLLSIKELKLTDIKTGKKLRTKPMPGQPQVKAVKNKPEVLPKAVRKVFQTAAKTYKKCKLKPIALLGKQVVAGTNYRILCFGKKRASANLLVLEIYQNLKGKCTVTSCKPLLLEKYIGS